MRDALPYPKLYRAQPDDNPMLVGELLPNHLGIAVMPEKTFAEPIIQAIKCNAANRLFEWLCSTLPQITGLCTMPLPR